jgi:hypothetical protein
VKLEFEDDGFLVVKVGEADARVDLYAAFNRLVEIGGKYPSDEDGPKDEEARKAHARLEETVELMVSLGLPRVSHRAAVAFTNGIMAAVGALEKKDQSPGSAAPTPGSPPASGSAS